jgi:ubiquinol-cytochrome c reductase cytochrome b subunit
MTNWLTNLLGWVDARMPIKRTWNTHLSEYYAPKNFNFWYIFGVLSMIVLVNQLLTGIWLTMNYTPSAEGAFASVEYIMRDVPYGYILRYMHSTGASAFFAVVYLHMFRGLMYGSYKAPRELVWIFGMTIYLVLMAEAFMGYVLPWGQMSYWGAQVIVSLFGAIPVFGDAIVEWVRGDYLISGATLNRFFALHVVALPLVLVALVFLHIVALHEVGSNNPDGIDIKKNKDENGVPLDGIPFHPYYTTHDLVGITVFLFVFCGIMFFAPEMGGFFLEYPNFEEANSLKTPEHIAPVWYFTPFYAMLRAVTIDIGPLTSKFLGFIVMGAAIAILFVLPWLDRSPVKSIRYKGWISRIALIVFAAAFVILGYLGVKAPTPGRTILAQICTVLYFAYFIGMPFWTAREKTFPEPERVRMKGLGMKLVLGGLALFVVLVLLPIKAVGAEGGACGTVPCDSFEADFSDKESLQRGLGYFSNYCMGCHSAEFARFERVADDLDIPHEVMLENVVPTGRKIGDLMENSMLEEDAKAWFGVVPADLTLVARARSPEWLYTYLRNFYQDDSRPVGVNNRVFPNVGMPHVLMELQGLPQCAPGPKLDSHGEPVLDSAGNVLEVSCGTLVVDDVPGMMTTEEYDQAVYDLVNFLEYMGEPAAEERERIGIYVLLFLMVLLVFTWLLNREYWKDVH